MMSSQGVLNVIGRIITDEQFKKEFFEDPKLAVEHSGYAVAPDELAALAEIKPTELKIHLGRRAEVNLEGGSSVFVYVTFKPAPTP